MNYQEIEKLIDETIEAAQKYHKLYKRLYNLNILPYYDSCSLQSPFYTNDYYGKAENRIEEYRQYVKEDLRRREKRDNAINSLTPEQKEALGYS